MLLAVGLLAPAPAAADESVTASGSLTYTWHGDPSRGCAAVNLCGVEGALSVDALRSSSASSSSGNTPIASDFSAGTVRVLGAPGAAPGACVDVPSGPIDDALFIRHGPRGSLIGEMRPPLASGRCAGPTEQDLGQIKLPVVKTGTKRRTSFDLRSTQAFAAGPFSGSVVSTLVLTATGNGGLGGSSSGSFFGPPPSLPSPPARHKVLLERVALRYRLVSLPGSLDVAFLGGSGAFCLTLGSCGASGTLALTLPGFDRSLTITASRVVRRRVGAHQALADLRHGRLDFEVDVPPPSSAPLTTQVTETFQARDGSRCADTAIARGALLFFGTAPGGRGVSITLSDPDDVGLARTHCPGPSDSDAFGNIVGNPFGGIATGMVAPAALTSRQTVVSLAKPGSSTGVGYVATRSGALPLSLSLVRVLHAGTVRVTR